MQEARRNNISCLLACRSGRSSRAATSPSYDSILGGGKRLGQPSTGTVSTWEVCSRTISDYRLLKFGHAGAYGLSNGKSLVSLWMCRINSGPASTVQHTIKRTPGIFGHAGICVVREGTSGYLFHFLQSWEPNSHQTSAWLVLARRIGRSPARPMQPQPTSSGPRQGC